MSYHDQFHRSGGDSSNPNNSRKLPSCPPRETTTTTTATAGNLQYPNQNAPPPIYVNDSRQKYVPPDHVTATSQQESDLKTQRFDTLMLIAAVVFLFASIFLLYFLPKIYNPNLIAVSSRTKSLTTIKFLNRLKKEFKNQTAGFNARLASNYETSIVEKQDPSIILLVSDESTSDNSRCVSRRLLKLLNEAINGRKLNNEYKKVIVNAKKLSKKGEDEAKDELDANLTEIFTNQNAKVALVDGLQYLPPKSALLFYTYGDDQTTARYKGIIILLTLEINEAEVPRELANENAKLTEFVEKKLSEKWSSHIDYEQLRPLYSRIASSIILLNHETNCE